MKKTLLTDIFYFEKCKNRSFPDYLTYCSLIENCQTLAMSFTGCMKSAQKNRYFIAIYLIKSTTTPKTIKTCKKFMAKYS